MSKKQFIAIAEILSVYSNIPEEMRGVDYLQEREFTAKKIAESVADYFAKENPAFDRARFLKACGVA